MTTEDASLLLTPKTSTPSAKQDDKNQQTPPFSHNNNGSDEIADLKNHIDKSLDRILTAIQAESSKRIQLEQRFHSQLLLQSENMVAMELKLLKLEAKLERRDGRQQPLLNGYNSSRRGHHASNIMPARMQRNTSTEVAIVASSGASLTSGVTEDYGEQDVSFDGSDSTPTFGSRPINLGTANLESILTNPRFGEASFHGESSRATRGTDDGNSSLATSITGSTLTTRGGDSSIVRRPLPEAVQYPSTRASRGMDLYGSTNRPRSRSQSPLTVQSSTVASEVEPDAIASILSNVAVAPSLVRRRVSNTSESNRSSNMANRVVSFSTADVMLPPHNVALAADEGEGIGDSITMPDELDNLSEVADTFASGARMWREEYEARLDALQKKFAE